LKKIVFRLMLVLLFPSLFACSIDYNTEGITGNDQIIKGQKIINHTHKDKEIFTKGEVLQRTIRYHNTSDEPINGHTFSVSMSEHDKTSQKVQIGGKCCQTTQLDQTVIIEYENNLFLITLKENYNMKINGREMISYWKYEVSTEKVKLLDKDESGFNVYLIK
jgi:hypothetical protein